MPEVSRPLITDCGTVLNDALCTGPLEMRFRSSLGFGLLLLLLQLQYPVCHARDLVWTGASSGYANFDNCDNWNVGDCA